MNHLYRLLILCTILVLVGALIACGELPANEPADTAPVVESQELADLYAFTSMPTIGDYTDKVDPDFDLSSVRLMYYVPETDDWTNDPSSAPFDESKPTYIHAHGQGWDGHMYTARDMYNRGYNIINFYWGTFASDDLYPIEYKIWDNITQYTVRVDGRGKKIKSNAFSCTVPEIYAARYCDFFAQHPNYDQPIHMVGHSYGGQLTLAMSAYLTTLWKQGRLPARLLPDRYTLLDPYFDNAAPQFNCQWLGGQFFKDSSVSAAIYCLHNILFPNNIAIEMLRTSPYVEMSMAMGLGKENVTDYFTELKGIMRVVELANDDDLSAFKSSFSDQVAICHSVANALYPNARSKDVYYDEEGVAVFGCEMPAADVLLTNGMHFDFTIDAEDYTQFQNMEFWRTEPDEPETTARVGGMVYVDANGNGKIDESVAHRLHNAQVVVKDEQGTVVANASTVNGFWRVDVPKGKTYTVTVTSGTQTTTSTVEATRYANVTNALFAR